MNKRKDGLKGMGKRAIYLLLAGALALAFYGCGGKNSEAGKAKENQADKPVIVDAVPVKTEAVQRSINIVGTLEPFEEATVAAKIEATVSKVFVDLGDRVEKGKLLVKLDDEEFRIKKDLADASFRESVARLGVDDEDRLVVDNVSYVRKAQAELEEAERSLKRMKELEAKGYVSKSELDSAQAKRDMAKANLDSQVETGKSLYSNVKTKRASLDYASKQVRDTEVRAPISGYVSRRVVDPGDFAKVGGELIQIVSVDPLRLRGEVPEVHAGDVHVGQEVKVTLPAAPGKEYSGSIARISPASSRESRAFTVEVRIANKNAALKPGYFANAAIMTKVDKAAMMVPVNSVINFAGVNKVYVLADGKAYEKVVTPGMRSGDFMEVGGEVKPGDMVITTGMKRLYSGRTVSVRKAQ